MRFISFLPPVETKNSRKRFLESKFSRLRKMRAHRSCKHWNTLIIRDYRMKSLLTKYVDTTYGLGVTPNLNWMSQTLVLIQNLKKCTKASIWYINWQMRKTTSIQIKTHFWKSHRNTTKNYSSLQKQTLLSNRSYSRMLWRKLAAQIRQI